MRLLLTGTMLLSFFSATALAEQNIGIDKQGNRYVKGEMLVRVRSRASLERFLETSQGTLSSMAERKIVLSTPKGNWYKVKVDPSLEQHSVFSESLANDGVEFAEPNFIYTVSIGPRPPSDGPAAPGPDIKPAPSLPTTPIDDPDMGQLYGMKKIGAPEAWKTTTGSHDVIVADIDTGIDYNHVDLANNLWRNPKEIAGNKVDDDNNGYVDDVVGFNFRDKNATPWDDNEHGSHTAGTIAATGDNGVGVTGVAKTASIMGLRFLGGSDGSGTLEDAILAIDYATKNGASIMSNSWGGGGFSQAMFDSIKRADEAGILFVAAAGNESANNDTKPSYPASYKLPNVLTVAATDDVDGMAYFSNYGLTSVHLGAPGVKTYSTIPGNKYAPLSGTSMATPHVSGAAVLIKSQYPALKAKEIKDLLLQSVEQVSSLKNKTTTGGRLNVAKAMELAKELYGSSL